MTTHAESYLEAIGVNEAPPSTFAFDPGNCPLSLKSHIDQSAHLLCGIKLSMATWQIASVHSVQAKIASIKAAGLRAIAGGGPFEIAASFRVIPEYLDLCASTGFDCVEFGEGFVADIKDPAALVQMAVHRGLEAQYELGRKFAGPLENQSQLRTQVQRWIYAGAERIVVEAREDAVDVGLFDVEGNLNRHMADILLGCVDGNLRLLGFEAPTKKSQFALMEHFGRSVVLANVRLEEVLRVEVFRRGLHSRSFLVGNLRPRGPAT